ncbi:RING-7 protein [Nannizzia gypsea CBS 118893]|uniref:RING-7 protein n=1 Tax=Arthroderma gypseum (strain ATCC MYA-4604 / CBS 118893) TaxID=535722 RepID=E4V543_ARTGP|nr:RING-7 protein [Nannizzia gypsea CBS 118893]EFR05117.1 RING-7 protein [Nannizzia gypsea CBS 118893]
MASLRRLLALALSLGLAGAQSITPIESRGKLQVGSPLYSLDLDPEPYEGREKLHLYPSTSDLYVPDEPLKGLRISGRLVTVSRRNANRLKAGDIAYLSCDPDDYLENIDPSEMLGVLLAAPIRPAAILLYTTHAVRCDYEGDREEDPASKYKTIFSLRDPELANALLTSTTRHNATISTTGPVTAAQSLQEDPQPSRPHQGDPRNNGVETTRNTAMIILYAVTGIITLLFLAVILTGAIRAHRHPDRYGPRNVPGRARQSRAKGIARAMLDTLPIVKFGEDRDRPKQHDVELGEDARPNTTQPESQSQSQQHTNVPVDSGTAAETGVASPAAATAAVATSADAPVEQQHQEQARAASPSASAAGSAASEREPSTTCPICTDEFVRGQDVRLLPCNHSFHPECVDPWLVDVSGTCPLCRINLNPEAQEQEQQHDTVTGIEGDPAIDNRVRDQSRTSAETGGDEAGLQHARNLRSRHANADERRRNRLSARFVERFRIRTRQHGESDTPPVPVPSANPST